MKHTLKAKILESTDCCILCFMDTSDYTSEIEVTTPVLEIAPPNWDTYFTTTFIPESITLLSPEQISHTSFPSGLYSFRMSVCPNDKVYYKFCYLNICEEKNRIAELACEEDNLEKLVDIELKLNIAQRMVRMGKVKEGVEIYNQEKNKLNKFNDCELC